MLKKVRNKGITLVALIVTIIVLLILAGIVLSLVIGQGGIMNLAEQAGKNYVAAEEQEKNDLEKLYSSMMVATNDDAKVTISMQDLKTLIQEEIKKSGTSTNPTGTVISYIAGMVAPEGYLTCDGTIYNISDYPILADAIKNGLGSYNYYGGDGETTFAVPDLRGEFLRGTGTATRNTGAGATVGEHQEPTRIPWVNTNGNTYFYYPQKDTNPQFAEKITTSDGSTTYGYFISARSENKGYMQNISYSLRPTNTSVLYCIKY